VFYIFPNFPAVYSSLSWQQAEFLKRKEDSRALIPPFSDLAIIATTTHWSLDADPFPIRVHVRNVNHLNYGMPTTNAVEDVTKVISFLSGCQSNSDILLAKRLLAIRMIVSPIRISFLKQMDRKPPVGTLINFSIPGLYSSNVFSTW